MHTSAGDLHWYKPVAYQEIDGNRKHIACSYLREGSRLAFELNAYDHTKPLIIDPVLEYSTYLGGSGGFNAVGSLSGDKGFGVAVDSNGNAYVTGSTSSSNFPTKNAFQKKNAGNLNSNAFVTKFNTSGGLIYSTYLGGSGFLGPDESFVGDQGNGIAVDARGNTYVTGSTGSSLFPLKNAFQSVNHASNADCIPCSTAFVTKLDPAGSTLVFSTYLGGSGNFAGNGDAGNGIAVDIHYNVYVTGLTGSFTDFPTKNAFQEMMKGDAQNAFVTKFDAAGTALIYSTYLGGTGNGTGPEGGLGNGIAVDVHGNAYVIGTTTASDFPTKNAFQHDLRGRQNAFVTKFDPAGTALVYSTYLGGGGETGSGIAIDRHGDAYVTWAGRMISAPSKQGNMLTSLRSRETHSPISPSFSA